MKNHAHLGERPQMTLGFGHPPPSLWIIQLHSSVVLITSLQNTLILRKASLLSARVKKAPSGFLLFNNKRRTMPHNYIYKSDKTKQDDLFHLAPSTCNTDLKKEGE